MYKMYVDIFYSASNIFWNTHLVTVSHERFFHPFSISFFFDK